MKFLGKRMDLESRVSSKVAQTQTNTVLPPMWLLIYNVYMYVCKKYRVGEVYRPRKRPPEGTVR